MILFCTGNYLKTFLFDIIIIDFIIITIKYYVIIDCDYK